MSKVVVSVCSGTACYIQGGSDLLTLMDYLNHDEAKRVTLSGAPCLNHCKNREEGQRPPYVTINGKLHWAIDLDEFVTLVKEALEADNADFEK